MRLHSVKILESTPQDFITMDEARNQLRISNYDDDKVSACLDSAVSYVEEVLRISLRPQKFIASYELDVEAVATIPFSNFDQIESVQFFDGQVQTLSASDYAVDDTGYFAYVYLLKQLRSQFVAPLKITFKTKKPTVFPPFVKQAVLTALTAFYDDRNAPNLDATNKLLKIATCSYQ